MSTCLIITGGDFDKLPEDLRYDHVIACDHGYDHAKELQIRPDVMIGDLDSIMDESGMLDIPLLKYPARKDDSDTMLAVKYALSKGYDHLIIVCALGGRLDHTIANIQAMAYAAAHGAVCECYGDKEYLRTLTKGKITLERREGYSLSLFALSDVCKHVSIRSAWYSVEDVDLINTFPLGLSNGWEDQTVEIGMESGILLISESMIPESEGTKGQQ